MYQLVRRCVIQVFHFQLQSEVLKQMFYKFEVNKLCVCIIPFVLPLPSTSQALDVELPVIEPYFVQNPDLSESGPGLRVTWLGHATVLVEMDGLNILTDPIFSQRASPFQFMGPKRYRGPPCTVDQVEYFFYNEVYSVASSLILQV